MVETDDVADSVQRNGIYIFWAILKIEQRMHTAVQSLLDIVIRWS